MDKEQDMTLKQRAIRLKEIERDLAVIDIRLDLPLPNEFKKAYAIVKGLLTSERKSLEMDQNVKA